MWKPEGGGMEDKKSEGASLLLHQIVHCICIYFQVRCRRLRLMDDGRSCKLASIPVFAETKIML